MIKIGNVGVGHSINGSNVVLTVRYRIFLDPIDRHFAMNGVSYSERIRVRGADTGIDTVILTRWFYEEVNADIASGAGEITSQGKLILERERNIPVNRTDLQEDPAFGDNDEILCEISVQSPNFPTVVNPNGQDVDGTNLSGLQDGTVARNLYKANSISLAG